MLLRLLKSNSIGVVFFLPILAIVLWSDVFMEGQNNYVPLPYSMPAYALIMKIIPSVITSGITALLLIISQAFYLLYINKVYNFISQRTYLTSLLFVLISSAFLNLHYLHPAIIANVFVLFTIVQIFSSYRQPKVYRASYNSGFLIAIAGLFYINANFLLLFVFASLMVLHRFNWREWFSVVLGFLTPYFITVFLYYLYDQVDVIYLTLDSIVQYNSPKLNWPVSYYVFSLILFLTGLFSIFKLSSTYSNNKVSTRNYFSLFTILLFIVSAIFVVVPFASIELIVICAVPLSYLIANYYLSRAKPWMQEVSFLLLLGSFIFFYFQKYFEIGA